MKPEEAKKIVDTGIYRYSRNPMYLAMLLMLLSMCVLVHNYLSLIALPIFWAYITRFQIIPEERQLKDNFGKPYLDYVHKVRRWI
jgi:protein-S-isoprenylcysteine O-methyltransferase Ste14